MFYLGTSYNPNPFGVPSGVSLRQSNLQTIIGQVRIRVPNGLKLDIGARYEPAQGGFPAANGCFADLSGRNDSRIRNDQG